MAEKKLAKKSILFMLAFALLIFLIIFSLPQIFAPAGRICNSTSPCACGSACNSGNEVSNGYNTIDSCRDGPNYNYEWIHDINITNQNDSVFNGHDTVQADAFLNCDLDGDSVSFAYNNGSGWKNVGDATCSVDGYSHRYQNITLDNVRGYHTIRVIISPTAYGGRTGMTCGYTYDTGYSDSDDVSLYVLLSGQVVDLVMPSVRNLNPSGTEFNYQNNLVINISANVSDNINVSTVFANVSWSTKNELISLAHVGNGIYLGNFTNTSFLGIYNYTLIANDTLNNINQTVKNYFIINMTSNITVYSPVSNSVYKYQETDFFFEIPALYGADFVWYYLEGYSTEFANDNYKLSFEESGSEEEEISQASVDLTNISQSFATVYGMNINKISLKIKKTGNPENSTVEIKDNSGYPLNNAIATANITSDDVSEGSFEWVNLTFNQTVSLNADTTYWIYLISNGTEQNFYEFEINSQSAYAGGNLSNNATKDMLFRLYDNKKYLIRDIDLERQEYNVQFFANHSVFPQIESEYITFIVDYTPPVISDLTYTPSDSDGLDPGTPINVSLMVSDELAGANATLRYMHEDDDDWSVFEMENKTGYFEGNFTPDREGQWYFSIYVIDSSFNDDSIENNELDVRYEYNWSITPNVFNSTGGMLGTNITIGTLLINNSADFTYEFNVSPLQASPIIYINESVQRLITLDPGETISYQIIGTTKNSLSTDYINILVDAQNDTASPQSYYSNITLISVLSGPFLHVDIVDYSSTVVQGSHVNTIKARITNVGNETAFNVSANWTLPEGWTSREATNLTYDNISSGGYDSKEYTISADVSSSAPLGAALIEIIVNCSEGSSDSDTRTVTVTSASQDDNNQNNNNNNDNNGGGGGGSTGGGSTGGGSTVYVRDPKLEINISDFEIIRGQKKEFAFSIMNNVSDIIFGSINFSIEGLYKNYYNITPNEILNFSYEEKEEIKIIIIAPIYMQAGKHDFVLKAITDQGVFSDEFSLIVFDSAISNISCLDESLRLVDELEIAGFNVNKLKEDYEKASYLNNLKNYKELLSACDMIKLSAANAIKTKEGLQKIEDEIISLKAQGYNINAANSSLSESLLLLNSGEFDKAYVALKDSIFLLDITKKTGKPLPIAVGDFIKKNLVAILLGLIAIAIFITLSVKHIALVTMKRKLRLLKSEEKEIMKLFCNIQKEHFEDKIMGTRLYLKYMDEYRARLAKIKEETIRLELNILNNGSSRHGLNEHRKRIERLVIDIQDSYYNKKVLDKSSYEKMLYIYQQQLASLDEKILLTKKNKSHKNEEKKEQLTEATFLNSRYDKNLDLHSTQEENKQQEAEKSEYEVDYDEEHIVSESSGKQGTNDDLLVQEENLTSEDNLLASKKHTAVLNYLLHRDDSDSTLNEENNYRQKEPEKNISAEKYFILSDGRKIDSIDNLHTILLEITDETFAYHVSQSRNDFSDWITNVFNNKELGEKIQAAKTRKEIITVLDNFLSENEKD
ncbi:MAG: hypothetical protein V1859_01695 [archaeon]